MGTMTHADKRKLSKLTMQGLILKTVGVYSEHSCRVTIIY